MTNHKVEIAPGIFYISENNHCSLMLKINDSEELICWDYEEIIKDPNSWFVSLKAVALATQHGPSIAHNWIKNKLSKLDTPAGTIFCNMCNVKFTPADNHPYIFVANLNGNKYYDLQCSFECNKKRKNEVYYKEVGEEFLKLFEKKKENINS